MTQHLALLALFAAIAVIVTALLAMPQSNRLASEPPISDVPTLGWGIP